MPARSAVLAGHGRRRERSRQPASSRAVGQQGGRPLDQCPLVGVRQPSGELREGDPGDLGHLDVGVGERPPDRAEQEVVHRLVHAAALGDEPEVDDPERCHDLADDPGLLRHLADGGVLGGLALLDVPLGQRPQEAAAAIGAPDEGGARLVHPVVGDHQAPGGGLVDPAQPAAGAPASARPSHARRVARGSALPWLVVSAEPPSRPPREPVPPAVQETVRELVELSPVLTELGERFTAAGFEAHLVGGSVRDALLAAGSGAPRVPGDLDVTTDARPEQTLELLRGWAGSTWNTGIAFGTVGAEVAGTRLEITTFRADRYDRDSRNPEVAWGSSLVDDLSRRDFTVNAMAVSLGPDRTVTDPFGGLGDLLAGRLRTPGAAVDSFADDPLRMLRAVRFVAQLGLSPDDEVVEAMTSLAPALARITAERVQHEFSRTLLNPSPRAALELFVSTGLADVVLPELSALRMEIDEHHQHKDVYTHSLTVLDQAIALELADPQAESPDLVLRLAALLHDIGKPATRRHEARGRVSFHYHEVVGAKLVRKRLSALKYPKEVIEAVSRLTFLHLRFHGYGGGEWTDSAVRRYVTDAGDLLPRLHKLVRSDSTTRNRKRAAALSATYDSLERRIAELAAAEDLGRIRPDLDGNRIMELLDIGPGPEVGQAWRFLKDLRLERGPLDPAEAETELLAWWGTRS